MCRARGEVTAPIASRCRDKRPMMIARQEKGMLKPELSKIEDRILDEKARLENVKRRLIDQYAGMNVILQKYEFENKYLEEQFKNAKST